MLTPTRLFCDFIGGVETPRTNHPEPVFAWACEGTLAHAFQVAFRLRVYANAAGTEPVWDSGKVLSSRPFVKYAGSPLKPQRAYYWDVCLWDKSGQAGPLSVTRPFLTGSLDPEDNLKTSQSMVSAQRVFPANIEPCGPGAFLVDFGRDAFAGLELALGPENGETIEVRLGEALGCDGRLHRPEPQSRECNRRFRQISVTPGLARANRRIDLPVPFPGDGYQAKGYDNCNPACSVMCPEHLGELMPFRYCEIRGYGGTLSAGDIAQLAASYRFTDGASRFDCSDPRLNRVWDFCKYSIKATTPFAVYIDGDRERQPYGADAFINQLSHYCCDAEYSLARNTLEFFLGKGVEWGYESIMSIVLMAWTDYLYTGDIGLCAQYYAELKAMLFPGLVRDDGLLATGEIKGAHPIFNTIKSRLNLLRDLVDWPPDLRDGYEFGSVNTAANSFLHGALNAMRDIAGALGKTKDAGMFLHAAKRLQKAARAKLLDPGTGLFVDSEGSKHSSLQANIHAAAFGLAGQAELPRLVDCMIRKGMACGPWNAQFLLEALYLGGAAGQALGLMTSDGERGWLNMLKQGATITMECWTNGLKPGQDWNHAWSTAPANIVARRLMGIRPLSPGFGKILVQPQPGGLASAAMTHPSVRGDIKVAFTADTRELRVELDIPGNASAEASLPGRMHGKTAGKLFVDGRRRDPAFSGDNVVVDGLFPGRHELVIQA